MGKLNINPLLDVHQGGKYKKMIYINSYYDFALQPETISYLNSIGISESGTYGSLSGDQIYQAFNRFVKDLKGKPNPNYPTEYILDKYVFLLPFLGNAESNFNKSLVGGYTVTFPTPPSFSQYGIKGDGISKFGYVNVAGASFTPGNTHMSFYSRENITYGGGPNVDMGVYLGSPDRGFSLSSGVNSGGNTAFSRGYSYPDEAVWHTTSRKDGFFSVDRNGFSLILERENAILDSKTLTTTGSIPDNNIHLLCERGSSGALNFSPREMCFAAAGQSLTTSQRTLEYNAVKSLQVALERSV